MKFADTDVVDVIVNAHAPVPEHVEALPVPLHPVNTDPVLGLAVQLTAVPKFFEPALQFVPEIDPLPAPVVLSVKANVLIANVAVAVVLAASVNAQPPVPEHDDALPVPDHPENVEPVDADAEQLIAVPKLLVPFVQFVPDVVPDPVPAVDTPNV